MTSTLDAFMSFICTLFGHIVRKTDYNVSSFKFLTYLNISSICKLEDIEKFKHSFSYVDFVIAFTESFIIIVFAPYDFNEGMGIILIIQQIRVFPCSLERMTKMNILKAKYKKRIKVHQFLSH